ncbi:MAG: response regulator transcription factor [Flavipsychrobacter sp.]
MQPLAVGILEDNESLRKNIASFLDITKEYFVVFSTASLQDALQAECPPDFVLLDIHLEEVNGLDLIHKILDQYPNTTIIIMTGDKEENFIVKALEKGAKGYLYKPFALSDLKNTLQTVREKGSFLDADTTTKLMKAMSNRSNTSNLKTEYQLTDREMDIILLMKEGHSYKAIGEKLNISFHTVNHHLKNAYQKLNVKSRLELLATYMF